MINSTPEPSVKSPTIEKRDWTPNLLNAEGVNYFLEAHEAIQSYCNTLSEPRRRNIALQVETILINHLNYTYSEEEKKILIGIFVSNETELRKPKIANQSLYKCLQELDPIGHKLLEIPQNIDISLLKKLYRKAAKKYHPDVGGSHEDMIKVIETYSLFQLAISNYLPEQDNEDISVMKNLLPDSWDSWNFLIYSILVGINGTFLATDKAFQYLTKSYKIALSCSSRFISESHSELSSLNIYHNLKRALGAFKFIEELKDAVIIEDYLDIRWRRHVNYISRPNVWGYEMFLGSRVTLNHPEKARNAFRLGMIDIKQYEKSMQKLDAKLADELVIQDKIDKFIKKTGFIQKLSKSDYETKLTNTFQQQAIFPSVNGQYRFDDLSDLQKLEYLKAFSPNGSGILVLKYSFIRCNEILIGLIQRFNSIDVPLLEEEVKFFCENHISKYHFVNEAMDYLHKLDLSNRTLKLKILSKLDKPYDDNPNGNYDPESCEYKKVIGVYENYIKFMQMDINQLELYQKTGSYQDK